jgi:MFS family permease
LACIAEQKICTVLQRSQIGPKGLISKGIICYVSGLGIGFTLSSTFVALNHYFSKKRGQAIGLSMVGTALGMMAMPQAVHLLLEEYNFHGSLLILGGLALHALVGSMLLQPVEWHVRSKELKKEENEQHLHGMKRQVNMDMNKREFIFICQFFAIMTFHHSLVAEF